MFVTRDNSPVIWEGKPDANGDVWEGKSRCVVAPLSWFPDLKPGELRRVEIKTAAMAAITIPSLKEAR